MAGFFDKSNIIAKPGFNRWMVPPAALCVHLCIGQVYAFSVFKIPLTRVVGVSESAPADWSQPTLAWIFSLAIAVLRGCCRFMRRRAGGYFFARQGAASVV